MNHIYIFRDELMNEDQAALLRLFAQGVGAKRMAAIVVETDSDLVAQALDVITECWQGVVRMHKEKVTEVDDAGIDGKVRRRGRKGKDAGPAEVRKCIQNGRTVGHCPQCGKDEVILVKTTGVCKPCHMTNVKQARRAAVAEQEKPVQKHVYKRGNGQGGDGVKTCTACGREVPLRANGLCAACTLENGGIDKATNERIEKIVARAKGEQSLGGNSRVLPAPRVQRHTLVGRKF